MSKKTQYLDIPNQVLKNPNGFLHDIGNEDARRNEDIRAKNMRKFNSQKQSLTLKTKP